MVTRRDMISLAVAGLAGTALESSGAITRSALALRGAMMAIAKGEVMETVVTESRCSITSEVYAWASSLGKKNTILVRKDESGANEFCMIALGYQGNPVTGASSTSNGRVVSNPPSPTSTSPYVISAGAVWYVIPIAFPS